MAVSNLAHSPAWLALESHYIKTQALQMKDLFAEDRQRASQHTIKLGQILFDYSKNRITGQTKGLLLDLARQAKLDLAIDALFSGQRINQTENRAVLHTALRNTGDKPVMLDGQDVMPDVNDVISRMDSFSEQVRSGQWLGYSGKPIRHIVNIGIGGSDLGPKMVTHALKPYWAKHLTPWFVSNIDGADLGAVLAQVEAETTLFLVASKTFTTIETMANAHGARDWFLQHSGAEPAHIAQHFVALSSAQDKVQEFGIPDHNRFEFWDWVGGRYSLWSAIGLPIMLMVGAANFKQLLAGAHGVDTHFKTAAFEDNIPVLMAMLGIWYRNFYGADSYGIMPYDHNLRLLPAYLQQCDMESNGKSVTMQGQSVGVDTGPIIWGAAGTNGQHAFFQLLHQGTQMVPLDFIVAARSHHPITTSLGEHQRMLFSNCVAQSEALMLGHKPDTSANEPQSEKDAVLSAHRSFEGNRPSNTFVMDQLSPENLGALIALYEHKVFVQGVVWGLNSFDQWGVELGKKLAKSIDTELTTGQVQREHDSSTANLIKHYQSRQRK